MHHHPLNLSYSCKYVCTESSTALLMSSLLCIICTILDLEFLFLFMHYVPFIGAKYLLKSQIISISKVNLEPIDFRTVTTIQSCLCGNQTHGS